MKFKTVLVAATAGGIGYVLGTKAGRARFEQIRGQAQDFLKSPTVQDTVSNLSDTVRQSAAKLPDPVANVVTAAADRVKGSTATDSGPDYAAADFTTTDSTTASTDPASADTGATLTDTDTAVTEPTTPQSSPPPSSQQ